MLTHGVSCSFQISHRSEKWWWQSTQKVLQCQTPWAGGLSLHSRAAWTPALSVEGSKLQGCSRKEFSPQAWLLLISSVCCCTLLETGCWLGGPLSGAVQPCLGFSVCCNKIRYSMTQHGTIVYCIKWIKLWNSNEMVLLLQNRASQNY